MTLGVTGWQSKNQIQKPKVLFYQVWGITESTPGQLAHFALRCHSWSPSSQSCTFRVGRGRNKQGNLFRASLPLTQLCTGPTLIISLPPGSQPLQMQGSNLESQQVSEEKLVGTREALSTCWLERERWRPGLL